MAAGAARRFPDTDGPGTMLLLGFLAGAVYRGEDDAHDYHLHEPAHDPAGNEPLRVGRNRVHDEVGAGEEQSHDDAVADPLADAPVFIALHEDE